MKIRNKQEIAAFSEAVDRCARNVWLVAPDGERFDLKSERGLCKGLARLIEDEKEEMELFADGHEDEMILMDLYRRLSA